jgi:hypothetical protein
LKLRAGRRHDVLEYAEIMILLATRIPVRNYEQTPREVVCGRVPWETAAS